MSVEKPLRQVGDAEFRAMVAADACTLPTAEQPVRQAEFAALFATSLRGIDRLAPTRVRLEIDAAAAAQARDLAARESRCCSFFSFGFTHTDTGTVWMDVEVPAGRVEVLDRLTALAVAA